MGGNKADKSSSKESGSESGNAAGSISSYKVFMEYVNRTTLDENELCEEIDASGILSPECYNKWVETRKTTLKQPEESFRRVLTAHVCGLIGRKPFPADVEANLLHSLRRKQVWPCFADKPSVSIGIKGFRKTGFHESRRGIFGSNATSSSLSPRNVPGRSGSLDTIKVFPRPFSGSSGNGISRSSLVKCEAVSQSSHSLSSEAEHIERSSHYDTCNEPELTYGVSLMRGAGSKRCINEVAAVPELDPLHIFNYEANQSASTIAAGSSNSYAANTNNKRYKNDNFAAGITSTSGNYFNVHNTYAPPSENPSMYSYNLGVEAGAAAARAELCGLNNYSYVPAGLGRMYLPTLSSSGGSSSLSDCLSGRNTPTYPHLAHQTSNGTISMNSCSSGGLTAWPMS